ncbi:MAG: pyruvate kinase, partial [Chloroflexi bacterium]|nr:pyruvate kinase [Chloroflexota bacterium]
TDAVMLSAETAVGKYPVEAVQTMARIALEAEALLLQAPRPPRARARHVATTHAHAIAEAACHLAEDLHARAIAVLAGGGGSTRLVSRARPSAPIISCTDDEGVFRRLTLLWGVEPLLCPFSPDLDATIARVEQELVQRQVAAPGDLIVVVGSSPVLERGRTNFVKAHRISGGRPARGVAD